MLNCNISLYLGHRVLNPFLKPSSVPIRHSSKIDFQYLQRSVVPTFHFQKSLPRLPIPELEKTLTRYLDAIKPLTNDTEFKNTKKITQSFRDNTAKSLHEDLCAYDKKNKHTSYISGPWFEKYLESRVPLVLNYNPFLAFRDDPKKEFNTQLVRSSNMLISALRFYKSLKDNLLEPEVYHLNADKSDNKRYRMTMKFLPEAVAWYGSYLFKAFPLDMSQFRNLFNSTRIPQKDKDSIKLTPDARHILVMRNGHFYVFDVLDSDGNILPPSHVSSLLKYILSDHSKHDANSIATLTSEDRNTWAGIRSHLESIGNETNLQLIDSALFALVLDDDSMGSDLLKSAHHMLHGPSINRWFDKCFQLIITKDGKAALNFEHSWGDGVAVLRFFNEVFRDSTEHHFVQQDTVPANIDPSKIVQKLDFKLDESVHSAINKATEKYKASTSALNLDILEYTNLNRDIIKNYKLSPDSVSQIAFQMAFYKVFSKFVATYESCSTSAFKHGRTETVRPVTSVSKRCVESFHQKNRPSPSELRAMLSKCTKVHNQLTKEAAMGQGFDRHLFGLKWIAQTTGKPIPDFYQDPVYFAATNYTMSTSTLFGPAFSGGGFGPVVKDGFGIAYGFIDDKMGSLVSSYKPYRSSTNFVDALQQSLSDIGDALAKTK